MIKSIHKVKPVASLNEFLENARAVESFTSSNGRRYLVTGIEDDKMLFRRLDAKESKEWSMNLKNVFKAYQELEDFATINFKPFVPITHSPARGLLLHLGMLK
jgi:hypothetical protein